MEAQRIVSLLPGATEWICHLGLRGRLVGVSHECDFPAEVNALPRITRPRISRDLTSQEIDAAVKAHSESRTPLYDLDRKTLVALQPDLIVTQSLCNVCAVAQRDVLNSLSDLGDRCRLLDLRARTFHEVLNDATAIAEAAGHYAESIAVIQSLRARVERVRQASAATSDSMPKSRPPNSRPGRRPTVTLLEWLDPLFCAGHWTPELIDWAGGVDPIGRAGQPSRELSSEELLSADPDILLVACCGIDAARSGRELEGIDRIDGWKDMRCVAAGQVHLFDGSAYFNRPGPRLVDALESVASLVRRWQTRSTTADDVPLSS